ncbi:hypothetical protein H0H87_002327, partial [Tephrocybe sp. NHM501043]
MKQVRTGTGVGLRHPPGAAAFAAERQSRVSRVSFADTAHSRPSTDSRRTRAFHSTYIPPVPTRKDVVSGAPSVYPDSELEKPMHDERDAHDTDKGRNSEESAGHATNATLSPRQTTGAMALTPEDIRARIRSNSNATKPKSTPTPAATSDYDDAYAYAGYDEMMPALF